MQLVSALPENMDKYEAIFIPINDGKPSEAYSGTHWSLMVYIRPSNSFYYYDTLTFNNIRDGELTLRRMKPLLKVDKRPQFIPSSTPQQANGSDCGGEFSLYSFLYCIILTCISLTVSVISIIDYTLHQLLKIRGQKEPVNYNKIMILKPKYMSTPNQVRDNVSGMIKRLQQRSKSSSSPSTTNSSTSSTSTTASNKVME